MGMFGHTLVTLLQSPAVEPTRKARRAVSRNSILHVTGSFRISSGGVSVVITKHSAQPFASLNGPRLFTDSSNWNDEPVVKPLVISLEVIMKNEMVNRQT